MTIKTTIFTHCPRVSLTRITFCWWRHNRLLMASRWPDKCDAITWLVISNSLDIDFIHSDIHGRSSKKIDFKTFLLTYNALNQLAPAYLNECCCLYTPPGGFHGLLMIEPSETNFSEISIKIKTYSLKTCRWNLRVPHIHGWVTVTTNRSYHQPRWRRPKTVRPNNRGYQENLTMRCAHMTLTCRCHITLCISAMTMCYIVQLGAKICTSKFSGSWS